MNINMDELRPSQRRLSGLGGSIRESLLSLLGKRKTVLSVVHEDAEGEALADARESRRGDSAEGGAGRRSSVIWWLNAD